MATLDDLRAAFQDLADDAPRSCPSDYRSRRAAELPDVHDTRQVRRQVPRWVPPLAAAVAAAVVAGAVVAIEHSTGHRTPPAHTRSATESPIPHGSAFCTATLPPVSVGPIPLGTTVDSLDGAFTDGSLIVGLGQGRATTLKRVSVDDGQTINLLSVPARSGATVSAEVAGVHALLMVSRNQTIDQLYAYNGSEFQQTRVVPKTPIAFSGTVDSATIMDGTAYWDERTSSAATSGRVVAYDITTGKRRVAWQGTFPDRNHQVVATAGGVYLGALGTPATVLIAARHLPAAVAAHMTPDIRESLLVSGDLTLVANGGPPAYAWLTSPTSRVLNVWRSGMSVPQRVDLGTGSPQLVNAGSAEFSFDGRWLYAGPERLLIDLDTNAMARLPGAGTHDVIAGVLLAGIDGTNVTRIPITDLPDLHC